MIYAELTGNYKMLEIKNFNDNTLGNWELILLTDWALPPSKIASVEAPR